MAQQRRSRNTPVATVSPDLNRRDQILRIAAEVFNEKGYRGATLSDISDALGFTRAALYYYFESKEEILTALFQAASERLLQSITEALMLDGTATVKLRRILAGHLHVIFTNGNLYGVFFGEKAPLPDRERRQLLAAERKYIDRLASVIQEGVDAGEFQPTAPTPTALLLLGMLNSVANWYRPSGELSSEDLTEVVLSLALRSVKSDAPRFATAP